MPGDYKTLRREGSDAFIVNKSRFIGYAAPCETEDAALAFLRRIRDGACGLFGTVLSPDYNAPHADHLHMDMAAWSVCR